MALSASKSELLNGGFASVEAGCDLADRGKHGDPALRGYGAYSHKANVRTYYETIGCEGTLIGRCSTPCI